MDVPKEIMQLVHKHTSWQTMEDLDRDVKKASKSWNEILNLILRISKKRTLNDTVNDSMETYDHDVEVRLKLKGEIVGKVLDARNLCNSSSNVIQRVSCLKNDLEAAVNECRRQMEYDEATREKILCNAMKEALGDKVENVVVSSMSHGPCILRDSGKGGKRMEINPTDVVIQDLLERVDDDKNDFDLRDEALLLFNHAELYWTSRCQHFEAKLSTTITNL